MQHSISWMANNVDPDQPASEEAGWSGSSLFEKKPKYWFRKMKKINSYCQSIYMVHVYLNANCDVTDKIVITSFSVNKQVDQGL